MSTTLSPSNLKTVGVYNDLTWAATYNANLVLLNSTLLKLSELLDVAKAGVADGKILVYNAATSKWIPIPSNHKLKATGKYLKFL